MLRKKVSSLRCFERDNARQACLTYVHRQGMVPDGNMADRGRNLGAYADVYSQSCSGLDPGSYVRDVIFRPKATMGLATSRECDDNQVRTSEQEKSFHR
jgi:hypothetical protein